MAESTAVAVRDREPASLAPVSVWGSMSGFEGAQRMARVLADSAFAPEAYRGNVGNALIALDMAQRINCSPLMVMQNLNIIEGQPSWGSSFIIAALNACGKFSPIRFKLQNRGEVSASYDKWVGPKGQRTKETSTMKIVDKVCVAVCIEKATGEVLEGPEVSIRMAVAEGWYTKPGSKWVTMEDLMLRYRSAAFFGRLYSPDLLMGFHSRDELDDIEYSVVQPSAPVAPPPEAEAEKPKRPKGISAAMKAAKAADEKPSRDEIKDAQIDNLAAENGDYDGADRFVDYDADEADDQQDII